MGFAEVDAVAYDPKDPDSVYAEGWQTWSKVQVLSLGEWTAPAPDERAQTVLFRPGKPVPANVIQAEGVLVIGQRHSPTRAWFAPRPAREVATLRVELKAGRAVVSADGEVARLDAPDFWSALYAVGDRLRAGSVRTIPPGWCSWSYYFKNVTEADVVENVEAARRLDLPIEVVQIDDGYEKVIGDWLDVDPRFGSLRGAASTIRSAGMVAGVWIPPFMVDPRSELARKHPDWLVDGADAGTHWDVRMRILDVTNRGAADYLREVLRTFSEWGYSFFKLDFLYALAICGVDVYREGMALVREAVGPDAILLIGGAPLLPSIGLCDAMRVGPDVLPETPDPQPDIDNVVLNTWSRRWMHRRLWVNDPDHVVARSAIRERHKLAAYLAMYGGVRFSGDRLSELDERGLELTRQVLSSRE